MKYSYFNFLLIITFHGIVNGQNSSETKISSRISVVDGASYVDDLSEQRNYQNLDTNPEPYGIEFNYHNYDQLTKFLRTTTAKYPTLTALYSIGKSVQGRLFVNI